MEVFYSLWWIGWGINTIFNVDVRKKGFVFIKCVMCKSLKDLISKLGKNSNDAKEYALKLIKHLLHQKLCISLYHTWRSKYAHSKYEFLCVIHDKNGSCENCTPKVASAKQNDLWAWTIAHYVDGYDSSWSWRWEICTIFHWSAAYWSQFYNWVLVTTFLNFGKSSNLWVQIVVWTPSSKTCSSRVFYKGNLVVELN